MATVDFHSVTEVEAQDTPPGASAGLRERHIGLVAFSLAGALWLANVAIGGTGDEHTDAQSVLDYAGVVIYSAALFGLVPALLVIRSWDRGRSGALGAVALVGAAAGASIAALANFGEDALGVSALGDAVYFPAVLVVMLGLLLLGVALLRAPAPWRWIAAWPLAMLVAFLSAGNEAGLIVGPVLIALGALLWVRRGPFSAEVEALAVELVDLLVLSLREPGPKAGHEAGGGHP